MCSLYQKDCHCNGNSNSYISSAPPTIRPMAHSIVSMQYKIKTSSDGTWKLLLMTTSVWVLWVAESMHEVQPQKMHGPRFATLFTVDEDRHCWRCTVMSVLGMLATSVSKSVIQSGVWLIRALCTSRHSLYSIRCATGNQCNSRRAGVTWSHGFRSSTSLKPTEKIKLHGCSIFVAPISAIILSYLPMSLLPPTP